MMRSSRRVSFPLLLVLAAATPLAQTPNSPEAPGASFDAVSIKRNISDELGSRSDTRPNGALTLINISTVVLVRRAYPLTVSAEMVGLPGWATSERYDVTATSTLSRATPDEQTAMVRALLADRFKFVAHVEKREQPAFDLVLVRTDGRLGPNIRPADVDCDAKAAEERAAAETAGAAGAPPPRPPLVDLNVPSPPCIFRAAGSRLEGDMTIAVLATVLRGLVGRFVVDKTGRSGHYRIVLEYDRAGSLRGPEAAPTVGAVPSIFTAVQEQLGLKLESSKTIRDILVIDRMERPVEN